MKKPKHAPRNVESPLALAAFVERQGDKATKRQGAKVKASFYLPAPLFERLKAYAAVPGRNMSAVVVESLERLLLPP